MFSKTEIVEQHLLNEILSGNRKPGAKIPSQAKLMNKFGFSRTTVERAVARLTAAGYLNSRQGGGTFVRSGSCGGAIREVVIIGYNGPMYPFSEVFFNIDTGGRPLRWLDPLYASDNIATLTQPGVAVIWVLPKVSQMLLMEHLKARGIAQLVINRDFGGIDRVCTDSEASIREGLNWLMIEAGREIAFICHKESVLRPYQAERIITFYELCFEFGVILSPESIFNLEFTKFTECFERIGAKLFARPRVPRGIFVMNYELVIPTLMCASGYGLKMGRDFFLLTFDKVPGLEDSGGAAMICQSYRLFRQSVERWLRRIDSGDRKPFDEKIKATLEIG